MSNVVQAMAGGAGNVGDESQEQARARKVAVRTQDSRQLQMLAIRTVSVATVLTIWEFAGREADPVLFTTPLKIVSPQRSS